MEEPDDVLPAMACVLDISPPKKRAARATLGADQQAGDDQGTMGAPIVLLLEQFCQVRARGMGAQSASRAVRPRKGCTMCSVHTLHRPGLVGCDSGSGGAAFAITGMRFHAAQAPILDFGKVQLGSHKTLWLHVQNPSLLTQVGVRTGTRG